jgi:hypothetical protein
VPALASAQGLDEVMAEAPALGWEPALVWVPAPALVLDRVLGLDPVLLVRATVKGLAVEWGKDLVLAPAGAPARAGAAGLAAGKAEELGLALGWAGADPGSSTRIRTASATGGKPPAKADKPQQ